MSTITETSTEDIDGLAAAAATQFSGDQLPGTEDTVESLRAHLDKMNEDGVQFLHDLERDMWQRANRANMCSVADSFLETHGLHRRPQPVDHAVDVTFTVTGRFTVNALDEDNAREILMRDYSLSSMLVNTGYHQDTTVDNVKVTRIRPSRGVRHRPTANINNRLTAEMVNGS